MALAVALATFLPCSDGLSQLSWHLQAVRTDLSNFEDSGSAWPYLLDDFVDWMRDGNLMDTS